MKNIMFTKERRNKIIDLVKLKKRVDVNELAKLFDVTGSTIRTDLKELEREGLLTRTHGGAIALEYERTLEDIPLERINTPEKIEVAKEAINLVNDNEVIAIDTGTSCQLFAEELIKSNKKGLTILTYDLKIALLISEHTPYRVQILGGLVRNGFPYVSSGSILAEISSFSVDKAFIGTTAFDNEFGFSTPNYETAEIKRSLIQISKSRIILCDNSKINKRCFCAFARSIDCEYLIVDSKVNTVDIKHLQENGVNVIFAK